MYTITVFLRAAHIPPLTLVYKSRESFDAAHSVITAVGPNRTLILCDDHAQELIISDEDVSAYKSEDMDETRKLMIEHNAFQQITRTMMEARVADDPRARNRGATLLHPGMPPQNVNGR